jgi:hypothetical protein
LEVVGEDSGGGGGELEFLLDGGANEIGLEGGVGELLVSFDLGRDRLTF